VERLRCDGPEDFDPKGPATGVCCVEPSLEKAAPAMVAPLTSAGSHARRPSEGDGADPSGLPKPRQATGEQFSDADPVCAHIPGRYSQAPR